MENRDGQNYVIPIDGLCIGCGTCANICPTEVINVTDHGKMRTISIREEVIGTHPLERCEGCGNSTQRLNSWTTFIIAPKFTRTSKHIIIIARRAPNCFRTAFAP